jgi:hypothetical protein
MTDLPREPQPGTHPRAAPVIVKTSRTAKT